MQDPDYGKTVPKLILIYSKYSIQFIILPNNGSTYIEPFLRVCSEVLV